MEIRIGEPARREGGLIEVIVRFWDDSKPQPQDFINASIFLRTDETNPFVLKTRALMKAQELIVHNASIALGREDELLNDFILMYESIKGAVAGLEAPYLWPSKRRYEIPEAILGWREGDEITDEHRRALADSVVNAFNLPPDKAAEQYENVASAPTSLVADGIAVMIATQERMDAETFRRTFPTISKSQNLVVLSFLADKRKASGESPDAEDLS